MADLENKELDELEEADEIENYITLTDDNGEDVSFEIIDTLEYDERTFAVLLPFDDEDGEVVILEIIPGEGPDYDEFISLDDDDLAEKVFEKFKENYEGEYEFE